MIYRSGRIFYATLLGLLIASCSARQDALPPLQRPLDMQVSATGLGDSVPVKFTEFTLPSGQHPSSVAIGRDDNAWVVTGNAIDRITSRGDIVSYATPQNVNLAGGGIADGSDGALWFMGLQLNVVDAVSHPAMLVYRITTGGALTSYMACSDCDAYPGDITAGADHNLWFTIQGHFACGVVGAVSTNGSFEENFPTLCEPTSVVNGPDDATYATVSDRFGEYSAVYRLSPSGSILNTYVLPPASNPESITVGPDRRLWMTLVGSNAIAAMTTAGTFTMYPLPTAQAFSAYPLFSFSGAEPARIISGPLRSLWFIESNANKIARMTVSGRITEYAIPTANSGASGLAACVRACARGRMRVWFTESNAGKVANLTLP